MSYSPPSFSSVNFNFTGSYTPPSPSSVNIEFLLSGDYTLGLNSAVYTLAYSPITYSRTYQLLLDGLSESVTLSPLILGRGYKLSLDSTALTNTLSDISYDQIIRNLTSSYSLILSSLTLSVAKVPLDLDNCNFSTTLSSIGLLYNRAVALSTPYTLSLANTALTYTPVAALLQLESDGYSVSAGSIIFSRTHFPLVLSSSEIAVSGGTIGYSYNRSINLTVKEIILSTSLEEKVGRMLELATDYYSIDSSDVELLANSKLDLIGSLGTLSLNDTSLLYNKSIDILSLPLLSALSSITPVRTRLYPVESISYTTALSNVEYKNYKLSLSSLPFSTLLSPISFNYLRSALSIQTLLLSPTFNTVGLLLTNSLPLDLVNILVISDTSILAIEDIKVVEIGTTNIIELKDKCKIFETIDTNIVNTSSKVILINTTKAN